MKSLSTKVIHVSTAALGIGLFVAANTGIVVKLTKTAS